MESHKAGFPPFPHSLEIPAGFPHSHGLDDELSIFKQDKTKPKPPQGAVTDVPGPKRNACPGTLIPQEGLVSASRGDALNLLLGLYGVSPLGWGVSETGTVALCQAWLRAGEGN
jgi:hypothetical protein